MVPESEQERFHADWERRAFALVLAMGATGSWNIDMGRAARESLPGYLQLSYFHIWLAGLEKLMIERGQLFADELNAGLMLHPPAPVARVLLADQVVPALARGSSSERPGGSHQPQFQIGQRVRTRTGEVAHHTRLPGYVRGKWGTIERLHGNHVFADASAQGLGDPPQMLYTVVFEGRDLWGDDAAPGLRVSVDAWEAYLHAA